MAASWNVDRPGWSGEHPGSLLSPVPGEFSVLRWELGWGSVLAMNGGFPSQSPLGWSKSEILF